MILVTEATEHLEKATIAYVQKNTVDNNIVTFSRGENKTTITNTGRVKKLTSLLLLVFIVTSSLTSCSDKKTNETSTNQQQPQYTNDMKKILIVGMDPHTIDFTNPEIPQGLTVEKIEKGAKATLEKLNSMGYDAEPFLIETGSTDLNNLEEHLTQKNFDGIIIGNGIRSITSNFILFEQIINVVHTYAPKSKIIFNTLPSNTDEAVKRWL